MKKIFLIIICFILIGCKSSNEQKSKNKNDTFGKSLSSTEDTSSIEFGNQTEDTIKIEFGNQFVLYWYSLNNEILKDENYYKIKKNKSNIMALSKFISNEDIICKRFCGKENALKKGDVAFLYLEENQIIALFRCLQIQFDTYTYCKYPDGLLDYIESNRALVYQKVQKHLKSKYNYPD